MGYTKSIVLCRTRRTGSFTTKIFFEFRPVCTYYGPDPEYFSTRTRDLIPRFWSPISSCFGRSLDICQDHDQTPAPRFRYYQVDAFDVHVYDHVLGSARSRRETDTLLPLRVLRGGFATISVKLICVFSSPVTLARCCGQFGPIWTHKWRYPGKSINIHIDYLQMIHA